MSKSKNTFLTGVTSILLTVLSGLTGLVVTRVVIMRYGSDFNGLNSTVTQFINMMLVVEGGFTLASSVALFKPLTDGNTEVINGILSATRIKFNKISILFLVISLPVSIVYSLSIKTSIDLYIVIIVFAILVMSTFFNLLYTSKYRIIIQTDQREYIINIINIANLVLTQGLVIILAFRNSHMISLRLIVFIGAIASQIVISLFSRNRYSLYNFNSTPLFSEIKGTRDVLIQRITSIIFNTVPILFISSTVGTLYASVYFVYSSVIMIIRSVLYSIINAPLMSLGKLISENRKEYTFVVFLQYEYIVNYFILLLLSVTSVLIIPFVKIYSAGVSDVIYTNYSIAAFIVLTAFFEMIHIPCGNILNMAGLFHIVRKIQIRAGIMLVTSIILGQFAFGLNGILVGVLLTSIFLATQEILYIYNYYFDNKMALYLKHSLPLYAVSIVLVFVEISILPEIPGYFQFFIVGIILVSMNSILLLLANLVFNRNMTKQVLSRITGIIKRHN